MVVYALSTLFDGILLLSYNLIYLKKHRNHFINSEPNWPVFDIISCEISLLSIVIEFVCHLANSECSLNILF